MTLNLNAYVSKEITYTCFNFLNVPFASPMWLWISVLHLFELLWQIFAQVTCRHPQALTSKFAANHTSFTPKNTVNCFNQITEMNDLKVLLKDKKGPNTLIHTVKNYSSHSEEVRLIENIVQLRTDVTGLPAAKAVKDLTLNNHHSILVRFHKARRTKQASICY